MVFLVSEETCVQQLLISWRSGVLAGLVIVGFGVYSRYLWLFGLIDHLVHALYDHGADLACLLDMYRAGQVWTSSILV